MPKRVRTTTATDLPSGVINAYVYGRLTPQQVQTVEEALERNPQLRKKVDQVEQQRLQLRTMIPNGLPDVNARKNMSEEMQAMSAQAFPEPRPGIFKKIAKLMDKTIIEF